ncbi:MAG: adenosylmethionine-8-amino-7-oxononanoate aminotransferase [Candidatus Endobugula sp.]|jgi:adenosylmethionine-8-amino-7-oxononanoate aminotransferase
MDLDFDRQHIWHPYASITQPGPVFPVVKTEGVYLHLEDGRHLVDGMSSWWCALHGYNHPVLNQAIINQVKTMSHVMFGGLSHEPAITLCKKLVALTPTPLQKVFLVDSGSVAVEVAIKMALQYWQARGKPEKQRLLSLRNGYHGDTFAAMSVCDPSNGMHQLFSNVLMPQHFTESPSCGFDEDWDERYIADFAAQIEQHQDELAAVILEPIVQGAGGMRFYSPHYLKRVREICDDYELLLIADEIATGFGRTGKLFACEHANISPDILCVGKSITGGMMTLAATLCSEKVSNTICNGETGLLMHGPTFMGNPLACAVANASIELLLNSPWQDNVARIESQLREELNELVGLSGVTDVRCLGAIGVIELAEPIDLHIIQPLLVEQGIWVRPFGKLVYLMPAFIMQKKEISMLTRGVKSVISTLLAG